MRVVFDTNIYISAFAIPGGRAEAAYLQALRGTFELVTSVAILTETAHTLQRKFHWSKERARRLVKSISSTATVVRTTQALHVVRDEPDNRILECAVSAGADVMVTGDRHLLTLRRYGTTPIVPLSDFLASLPKAG